MKQDKGHGLARITLALTLAGYYVAPIALAEDNAWVDSDETNTFQGTISWLYSEGGSATADADHVALTSDLKSACPQGSKTDRRLYSDDRLTVSWEIGDIEGNVDLGGLGDNTKTIGTIHQMSYKNAQGGDPKELVTKVTSYTLTDVDRGCYIGVGITPITQTGTSNVRAALRLYDVSTASSGESDSDNVAPGPVVNQDLKAAIFVDGIGINLINDNAPIELGETCMTELCSDENKSGKFGAGTGADVTANYDFRWVPSGGGQQLGTSGGIVNSSFDSNNLVIPTTNDETRTNLSGPAHDGKGALPILISDDRVQGYRLHIIYKHK